MIKAIIQETLELMKTNDCDCDKNYDPTDDVLECGHKNCLFYIHDNDSGYYEHCMIRELKYNLSKKF